MGHHCLLVYLHTQQLRILMVDWFWCLEITTSFQPTSTISKMQLIIGGCCLRSWTWQLLLRLLCLSQTIGSSVLKKIGAGSTKKNMFDVLLFLFFIWFGAKWDQRAIAPLQPYVYIFHDFNFSTIKTTFETFILILYRLYGRNKIVEAGFEDLFLNIVSFT